jgi:hypothetical protein
LNLLAKNDSALVKLKQLLVGAVSLGTFLQDLNVKLSAIALLLMGMTSCSDEQQQTERQIRALLSWSATADMILNARAQMLIPAGFSTLAIDRCKNEISSLSKELAETSPQDLTVTIGRLNEIIDAANDDIANGRADEASRHLRDLREIEIHLKESSGAGR